MNDAEALDLLVGAVSIPSVSGDEARLAGWLAAQIGPFADSCRVDDAGNVVATFGSSSTRLYCLGHIDTVPGEVPVRIEDGELWGRGSVDAKGSFCAHVAGVRRAFAADPLLRERLSVTLIGAVGEEAPRSVGARHAVASLPPPDLLLIGEPSGWQSLTLGYKGRLQLALRVTCPESHSAGRESSAADCLLGACAALGDAAAALAPEVGAGSGQFDRVQMTVGALASSSDGLEQVAGASVSFRLPPGVRAHEAERRLRRAAASSLTPSAGARLECRASGAIDAVLRPKDSLLSRSFRAAIRQHGGRPGFKVKTGTSDMNVVAPYWSAPALAYGPGDSALDHTPFERVGVAEYLSTVAVTATAISLLAGAVVRGAVRGQVLPLS